jgi:hypothetical protein
MPAHAHKVSTGRQTGGLAGRSGGHGCLVTFMDNKNLIGPFFPVPLQAIVQTFKFTRKAKSRTPGAFIDTAAR